MKRGAATTVYPMRSILLLLLISLAFGQTAKKKIVVVGLDDTAVAELRKSAPPNVRLVTPAAGQVADEVVNADAFISPQLTRELLHSGKQLKWVQILNAGVEDVLPLVRETNITLTNLKVVLGPEVADHAMALLLSLTRGLYETIPARGKWEAPEHLAQLTELRGKTAVIVGVGGVGTQIAARAAAFGMTIIGVDPKDTAPASFIKQMVKPNEIDTVLPLADVVFITVPETPATKGMMGAAQFQEMKRGAYFIAVSRGTVYSMDALVQALSSKRLAGAGGGRDGSGAVAQEPSVVEVQECCDHAAHCRRIGPVPEPRTRPATREYQSIRRGRSAAEYSGQEAGLLSASCRELRRIRRADPLVRAGRPRPALLTQKPAGGPAAGEGARPPI
jgi:phosphoglycerate dehydrogenase-like enzyme